jgi:hypothetical protein
MPRERRERLERLDEIYGFLQQSNISNGNLKRLEIFRNHVDPEVATLAALILDVARVLPGKRSRWLKLAQRHRPLFERALDVLGMEYFQDLLVDYGDFESPLWETIEDCAKCQKSHPE